MSKYIWPCGQKAEIVDGPYKGDSGIIIDIDFHAKYRYLVLMGYWRKPVAFEPKLIEVVRLPLSIDRFIKYGRY